ncbi:hypothetical protein VHUM_02841 [Vanrija humicola]|uniref:Uncharacterized protein n=1 Tax=Vanrija humicola TaxID=5417 RepID=A0A7D8UZ41_VANHU|nr:hypothetical protein VHUM_02841 [Vanrija humicola]
MPAELLSIPPAYTLIGFYRLCTDESIRKPVWDKVRHAAVRGALVGAAYAVLGWGAMDWIVRRFIVGKDKAKDGRVTLGSGMLAVSIDLVFYTHVLLLLPQLGAIMKFFIRKNLRIARTRAHNLTVASRGKPAEFWGLGYVEEWQQPPSLPPAQARGRAARDKWVRRLLWWPTQSVIRHYVLIPLSPMLPLIIPVFTSSVKALTTGEYLHKPYFTQKRMAPDAVWTWVEERKWAYRAFGFCAALLEGLPIIGLVFSVSNRIGAAMWAHDLEKRQHLFAHGVLQPLPPSRVGIFGTGSVLDMTHEVRRAGAEIEKRWSNAPVYAPTDEGDSEAPAPAAPTPSAPTPGETPPPPYSAVAGGTPDGTRRRLPPQLPPRPDSKATDTKSKGL